ncbi:sensor histidine kinase [Curvivirga aplysinae]|uniref:sensor histidine kinase n=1 Tax=Curvivirga aplysinae TaxID=2529852 RepID=UPI0012BB4937|nr:ATP-binding protein [Curvivirga aplysinae]MTI10291.1 hypothetical protein [Curvivirga aplysinae]
MLDQLKKFTFLKRKLSLPVTAIFLILSVVALWVTLNFQRNNTYYEQLKNHVGIDQSLMNKDISARISALDRMVKRWEIRGGIPEEEFIADADSFLKDYPGFQAIKWIDQDYIIRWVTPVDSNVFKQNQDLALNEGRRFALEKARLKKTPTVSAPIDLMENRKGFQIYFPLFVESRFDGFIVGALGFDDWINHVTHLNNHDNLEKELHLKHSFDYIHLEIFFDGELIYSTPNQKSNDPNLWQQEKIINLDGHRIVLQVTPTEKFFNGAESYIPEISAFAAFILALFLFYSVLLLNKSQKIAQNAKATNMAKLSFLSCISHETKTPLNKIVNTIELLQKEPSNKEQAEHLDIILQSAQKLDSTLNDVLDLSRIEAGEFKLKEEGFELIALLETILEPYKTLAKDKHLSLDVYYNFDTQLYLVGDPKRLRQILRCLVSNAIKYTDSGYVGLIVELLHSDKNASSPSQRIKFSVSDSGIGISPEKLKTIFTPFNDDQNATQNANLGLSMIHQLVHIMGGDIKVDSKEGIGSNFHLVFEFKLASKISDLPDLHSQT